MRTVDILRMLDEKRIALLAMRADAHIINHITREMEMIRKEMENHE